MQVLSNPKSGWWIMWMLAIHRDLTDLIVITIDKTDAKIIKLSVDWVCPKDSKLLKPYTLNIKISIYAF